MSIRVRSQKSKKIRNIQRKPELDVIGVNKKGQAQYTRFPLDMEAEIERLAEEEGRTKTDMVTVLVKMGLEVKKLIDSKFHMRDCLTKGKQR